MAMGLFAKLSGMLPKSRIVIAIIVFAVFVAVAFSVYKIYQATAGPAFVPNAEFVPGTGPGSTTGGVKVTMYGVKWCPHSRAARKHWDKWAAATNGTSVSGVPVTCETVDCEADDASKAKCQAAGVEGYPTVMAVTPSGEKVLMEAKTTGDSLTQFLAKVTQSVASGKGL